MSRMHCLGMLFKVHWCSLWEATAGAHGEQAGEVTSAYLCGKYRLYTE